jgi:hypothetical protein
MTMVVEEEGGGGGYALNRWMNDCIAKRGQYKRYFTSILGWLILLGRIAGTPSCPAG